MKLPLTVEILKCFGLALIFMLSVTAMAFALASPDLLWPERQFIFTIAWCLALPVTLVFYHVRRK